ncbi:MAG: site-2 protease family protein [Yaniella sp.]|uniref:site-2 protease family protein n=1 Tax=Yaniella sp. TaxID=2773929 RepID=UPI00264962CE|nr:site-2 protease family protein [Yaniella sp.]MDN5730588.1 site-2 protease family protein [Yaniella sp.]MDN5814921.1 site-2 protease family protein [Yaniella sp.]MDN5817326.1 site-2 protease family protein [Yaniella sp.]MDN5837500.1 site-2 protease family protein [Yaniella sp.]MDN5889619.1 site-2 protease family protein [Yaniella sp.]
MTAKKGLKIASLAGIPIYVSWSWWFFAALIMVVFRPTFSQALPDASTAWTWAVAAFFVLIMFGTVLIHELAHALAAISFRWKVNEVTLNFWGGATIYEHSSTGKEQTPLRSLTVAIVGPISNLVIAGAAWLLLQVLLDPSGTAQVLLTITVWTNLLIGIFNLLPGHPLDGGRVVESSVWAATGSRARGMRAAGWSGRVIVLLLFVGGVLVPLLQTGELSPFTLVIIVLLGAMLWQAASAAIKTAEAQLLAERLTIIELMTPVQTVLSHASISELIPLLNGAGPGREYQQLPIAVLDLNEHNGHEVLVGIVDSGALASVPRSSWNLPVSTVSRTVNPGAQVHSSDTVEHLFTTFMEFPNEVIAVIDETQVPHRILGIINPETLAGRLNA